MANFQLPKLKAVPQPPLGQPRRMDAATAEGEKMTNQNSAERAGERKGPGLIVWIIIAGLAFLFLPRVAGYVVGSAISGYNEGVGQASFVSEPPAAPTDMPTVAPVGGVVQPEVAPTVESTTEPESLLPPYEPLADGRRAPSDFTPPNSTVLTVRDTVFPDAGWPEYYETNKVGDPEIDAMLVETYQPFRWPEGYEACVEEECKLQTGDDAGIPDHEWAGFSVRPGDWIIFVGEGFAGPNGWYDGPSGGWFYNDSPYQVDVWLRYGEFTIITKAELVNAAARLNLLRVVSTNGLDSAAYLGEVPVN